MLGKVVVLRYFFAPLERNHYFISFILQFFRKVTLQHSCFSRGPPLKRKRIIFKLKYNAIILRKKNKSNTKFTEKNKCCYARMAYSFTLNVGKV